MKKATFFLTVLFFLVGLCAIVGCGGAVKPKTSQGTKTVPTADAPQSSVSATVPNKREVLAIVGRYMHPYDGMSIPEHVLVSQEIELKSNETYTETAQYEDPIPKTKSNQTIDMGNWMVQDNKVTLESQTPNVNYSGVPSVFTIQGKNLVDSGGSLWVRQ